MRTRTTHPDAQWFEALGPCCGCGKAATGILRGHRNDARGAHCQKCADRAIKAAHQTGRHMPDYVYEFEKARAP